MWTFETEGRGRRSTVKSAKNDKYVYSIGDVIECEEYLGAIAGFKQGESERTHEVQLLKFVRVDGELLATSILKWECLDDLETGPLPDKSVWEVRRAIDHHKRNKPKIEDLSRPVTLSALSTATDLLNFSKTVNELFVKPATPRKRRSPQKSTPAVRSPVNKELNFKVPGESGSENSDDNDDDEDEDEDNEDGDDEDDEELNLLPQRKRTQQQQQQQQRRRKTKPSEELASPVVEQKFGAGEESEDESEDEHKFISERSGQTKRLPSIETAHLPESTAVDRVIAELHPASDPPTHPCRDTQFDQLFLALESAIAAKTGTCIYVSGTPGTGKTSIIREVVAQLDLRVRENELSPFTFLEINGMKLVHPNAAYEHLWEVLNRGQMAASNAMTALEAAFSANEPLSSRGVIVLLLDEMDQLVTKGQQLMYNFFNWPSLPHSRLVVIAVANTMDLPERILSNKISSRVGLTRIQFPGYTHAQLRDIVLQRLGGSDLIEDEAVEYATRKVAGVGGDARRVLDFVSHAIALAASQSRLPVKTSDVRDVIVDSQTPPLATFIKTLGVATKILLCAFLARIRRTSNIEAPLHDVLKQAAQFVKSAANSEALLTYLYPGRTSRLAFFQPAVMELVESGALVQQAIRGEATPRIRLMVPASTITEYLEGDPDVKGMI